MDINATMFTLEVIGTISFAISGAIAGIKKEMDLLGVIIMGVVTATGGGFIRDITLGKVPPAVFKYPIYLKITLLSVFIFILLISVFKHSKSLPDRISKTLLEEIVNLTDAIGLGVFTVSGVSVAINMGYGENIFLLLFVGTITGVGGGMMRDVFTMRIPSIFVRHIYALACMIGALIFFLLRTRIHRSIAMVITVFVVIIIRHISRKYKLSLPKIKI